MSLRGLVLAGWAIAALLGSVASAQDKPLKISIRREWEGARTSAPVSLRAFVKWQKPELLEGRLQVNAFIDSKPISRWTGNDTALSDSEQALWFMTPRPVLIEQYERYVLEAQFLSETRSFDMEQLDVEVPVRRRRVMVVGVVLPEGISTPMGLGAVGSPGAFEHPFLMQQSLLTAESFAVHVHPSHVKPADFPADSLRLLGLDALLLSHDMLNQLRPAQLEAIRVWVMAGGSLALIQTGRLENNSKGIVQALSRNEWTQIRRRERGLPDQTMVFAPGLGQFIVATGELAGDSVEWARVARLLLRVQPEPAQALEDSRKLSLADSAGPQLLEPLPRFDANEMTNHLMPESIRGMPFGLAASVLACCLFCIAPGDYLLLGLLRRRKWTWALFPIVALSFTGLMAHLAAEHNGRNDSRTWISIVDVTPENEVLRTSRFELTYGASGRTVAHAVKDQWWADVRQEDFAVPVLPNTVRGGGQNYQYWQDQMRRSSQSSQPTELGERLSYHGSVPANYTVAEPVRQWAPRMQRITTLGADPALADYPLPQIDWDAILSQKLRSMAPPISHSMAPTLNPSIGKVWPNARWMIDGPGGLQQLSPYAAPSGTIITRRHLYGGWQNPPSAAPANERTTAVLQIVAGMFRRQSQHPGIFSLLSELSPTAGPEGEDLVITSRPTCVIVNEVEPGRYLVLRFVFPHDSPVGQVRLFP